MKIKSFYKELKKYDLELSHFELCSEVEGVSDWIKDKDIIYVGGGDTYFAGTSTNVGMEWDYSENALIFRDGTNASFGTGEDLEIRHDNGNTVNEIKSTNGKIVVSTTANDDDIEITPNGTGDVVIDGLKYPQADGSAGQVLKTDGSAQLSWTTPSADLH